MEHLIGSGERRRSFRINLAATASLWRGDELVGRFTVTDLSLGGCRLAGRLSCEVGQPLALTLRPSDGDLLRLRCKVVRCGENTGELGLCFIHTSPRVEDRIHDLIVASLERARWPRYGSVLVVHPHADTRVALAHALERLGQRVVAASSPVEALWTLEAEDDAIHTVIASRFVGSVAGLDVLATVAEYYPRVRRILFGGRDEPIPGAALDGVLPGSWDERGLRKVLPSAAEGRNGRPRLAG